MFNCKLIPNVALLNSSVSSVMIWIYSILVSGKGRRCKSKKMFSCLTVTSLSLSKNPSPLYLTCMCTLRTSHFTCLFAGFILYIYMNWFIDCYISQCLKNFYFNVSSHFSFCYLLLCLVSLFFHVSVFLEFIFALIKWWYFCKWTFRNDHTHIMLE